MTTVYKVLAQSNPTPNTQSPVYATPTGNSAVISTITICNMSQSANIRYSLAVQKANAALSSNHYVIYNSTVAANDTAALTLGLTLGSTDVLSANVNNANVSICVFGSEIY